MNKVFQLWGLASDDGLNRDHVMNVVDRLLESHPDYLVAGQSGDWELLRMICDRAHCAGVKVHQWASLFSENDFAADFDPLIGADGRPQKRVYGDNFNFRCPASEKNVRLFAALQQQQMQDVPFDGVFLDRVRYPSMSNGALACFCPDCVRRCEQAGLDVDRLRLVTHFGHYEGTKLIWADAEVQRFFEERMHSITRAVALLKDIFGEVSLDLFPPALMPLVGQDFDALAPLAAFVKPMLYRYTTAPAGLPYELDAFAPHVDHLPSAEAQMGMVHAPHIYWGIECVRVPGVAEMTPETIRESVALVRANGGQGVCASWNLIAAPDENLKAIAGA